MFHNDVYKLFENLFPTYANRVDHWFPNGKNSIRLRWVNGQEFVFTCVNAIEWKFETKENFVKNLINSLKENKK